MTLPQGWVETTLGSFAELVTSGSRGWAKYYADEGAAFLRIQNVRRRSIALDLSDVQRVNPPTGAEGERTKLQIDDIVITITADLGRVGICRSAEPAYVNQHIALVRLKNAEFAPYIATYLTTDDAQNQMGLRNRGVTRAGLGLDDIRAVVLPLPPAAEQTRIVAKLDVLIARLARARIEVARIKALADNLRATTIVSAFRGDLTAQWRNERALVPASTAEMEDACERVTGVRRRKRPLSIEWKPDITIPPSWRWASVDQVVGTVQYGTSAKTRDDTEGVAVLRMGNIQQGVLDWTKLKYLPASHEEFPALFLADGDVLFNRTNSPELVGKAAVYRGSEPVSFASYLIRVRCASILPDLLSRYLNSPIGREWVGQVASQQVGQANVNGTKLRALGIPLPPMGEQVEMNRILNSVFARADRLEAEAARARALLDRLEAAVLAKAFSGELVPQDPNDEPASLLLDRIRAERAAAATAKRGRARKAAA